MSLAYKFRRAERILQQMNTADRNATLRICNEIREAQAALLAVAEKQMKRCIDRCEGICCRNIELDPIISHWDLVFILALAPQIRSRAHDCLQKEDPLYRTDCVFLDGGKGPCVFPTALRPEVCVTTFCENDRPIRREIQRVKRRFAQLCRFVHWSRIRTHVRPLTRAAAAVCARFGKPASPVTFTDAEVQPQTSGTVPEIDDM